MARALGKRFLERAHRMPPMVNAGTYSATLHYLKALQSAGTRDTKAVMSKMRDLPIRDAFTENGATCCPTCRSRPAMADLGMLRPSAHEAASFDFFF
jgi:hypothetical protein